MIKQPTCYQNQYNLVVMNKFGHWLYDHRKELRLLQSDVAKRAGVSTSYISTLERGQPHSITGASLTPDKDKVVAIAKALQGDIDEALLAAGYAPRNGGTDPEGFYRDIHKLPVDTQRLAKRQIRGILDSLNEEEDPDTDYID